MPALGGGAVLFALFLLIGIGFFFCGFSGFFLCRLRGVVAPCMVPLAARVPSTPPVPPVIPPLPLLLRAPGLLGLRSRCRLAAGCLLWLL